jgi:hypothetical protein
MERRFGDIPVQIRKRLDGLTPDQIDAVALRLLDARRIEDLFVQ